MDLIDFQVLHNKVIHVEFQKNQLEIFEVIN